MNDMDSIVRLLSERIGLDPASLGRSSLQRAILDCFRESGADSLQSYRSQLELSAEQMRALTESLVVPETWFFRDMECFQHFSRWAVSFSPNRRLRVLSVPCASGEEPYSIAMILLAAGMAPDRFEVLAVDLSRTLIARARAGAYAPGSFRSAAPDGFGAFFRQRGAMRTISEHVKKQVSFLDGDATAANFLPGHAPFQAIFCRNLFIYLDGAARVRMTSNLRRLLAPGGMVVSGGADGSSLLRGGFCRMEGGPRFCWRTGSPPKLVLAPASLETSLSEAPSRNRLPEARKHAERSSSAEGGCLADARKLADAGRFHEALRMCENRLAHDVTNPDLHHLIGTVYDATGDGRRAAYHYGRAVYLRPDHDEALAQLGLHEQLSGDPNRARRLRRRAARMAGSRKEAR